MIDEIYKGFVVGNVLQSPLSRELIWTCWHNMLCHSRYVGPRWLDEGRPAYGSENEPAVGLIIMGTADRS
jgi:hypothetical protein